LSVRHPSRLARGIEGAMYLASSLPTIIVALALVTVTLRVVPGLYQTPQPSSRPTSSCSSPVHW
jgi:iron(III) transport system permease protein